VSAIQANISGKAQCQFFTGWIAKSCNAHRKNYNWHHGLRAEKANFDFPPT
jgi:hypothetical protein